jgi:hypothetical protein
MIAPTTTNPKTVKKMDIFTSFLQTRRVNDIDKSREYLDDNDKSESTKNNSRFVISHFYLQSKGIRK